MPLRSSRLAIDGGARVRDEPFPGRKVLGANDKVALARLIDDSEASGVELRYGGAEQRAYEREFAEYHGGGYARLVSSGTAALYVALVALALQRPGEILVPAITDAGGVMPVALLNFAPIPADTAEGSFNINAETVRGRATARTRAVVAAHIGGEPVDLAPLMAFARDQGLPVVEDCSQAHGAMYHGRMVGTVGTISIFSTMTSKHHCTGGQGGVIFTADGVLAEWIDRCIDRGKLAGADGLTRHVLAALNFNGSDLAAAIGRVQLRTLPDRIERRRQLVARLAVVTANLTSMTVVPAEPDTRPSYWFVRVRLDLTQLSRTKREVLGALRSEGIPAGEWANMPCRQEWYGAGQVLGPGSASWPVGRAMAPVDSAIAAAATHFVLFLHERWTDREVADVAAAMAKVEAAYCK
jgi:dTDP-4-amino-4,6-dideoxygalactose transaminase